MARSKKAQAAIDDALSISGPAGQVGLGVDLVDVARMRQVLARTPRFKGRVFTADEAAYCDGQADPAIHYAARFAAKEAAVKALGTGFSEGIGFVDVEVARNPKGRPELHLHRRAAEVAAEMGVTDMPLSVSHTDGDAVACVIAITKDATAAAVKRTDPAAELARQFKETRGMLDDLGAARAGRADERATEAETEAEAACEPEDDTGTERETEAEGGEGGA